MGHVEVPEGKTVLVSIVGTFTRTQTGSGTPAFDIGGILLDTTKTADVPVGAAAVMSVTGDVNFVAGGGSGQAVFEGTVYTSQI